MAKLTSEQQAQKEKDLKALRLGGIDAAKDGDAKTAGIYTVLAEAIKKREG